MRGRIFWVLIGAPLALNLISAGVPERISRADVRALGRALCAIGTLLLGMLLLSTAIASADPAKTWIVARR